MKRILALLLLLASATYGQGGRLTQDPWVSNRQGNPAAGATVAICQPLATTAASLTSTIATFTMASNPLTAGFVNGMNLQIAGFSGGDTYFNNGTIVNGAISGGIPIILVTSTQIIAGPIAHANGSAGSNGTLLQMGNPATPCAGLSTITSDVALSVPITNPLIADGLGNYGAYVAPGQYYTQIYGSGITTSIRPMAVACVPAAATGTCGVYLNGNNTWSGTNTFFSFLTMQAPGVFSSGAGAEFLFAEGSATTPGAADDVCYGDSAVHAIECSYNNGAFGVVPLLNRANTWTTTQTFTNTFHNNIQTNLAGSFSIGQASAPFSTLCLGSLANQSTCITSSGTANRAVNFPDREGNVQLNLPGMTGDYVWVSGSDFLTATGMDGVFQIIGNLQWTIPSEPYVSQMPFTCHLAYSEASGTSALSWGLSVSANPTNIFATGKAYQALTTATAAIINGSATIAASTVGTAVVIGTPNATGTVYNVDIDGFIEEPMSSANTISIAVAVATSADRVTVKRGSFCRLN